jgi:hypothetical protein
MLAHEPRFLLAAVPLGAALLPAGASRPSAGVVLAVLVFLVIVLTVNAIWELLKGPPNP